MTKKEEREIRRARKAIKRAAREKRRAEFRARKERRERIKNGPPIIVPSQDPTFVGTRTFDPLCYCEACRGMMRASFMFDEDICLACHDGGIE